MIEILEELDAANNLLEAALNRYLSACFALKGCCTKFNAANRPRPELSHRVTEELSQVSSCEARIKEARAAISLSRNSCMDIAPINSLPDEILGRISRLIHNARTDLDDRRSLRSLELNHIDNCSIVCSRWRQVSVSLGTLWSHIDLSLTQSTRVSRRYLDRALRYVARAGDTPLDVCTVDNLESRDNPSTPLLARTYQFLSLIAPCIRSFTLYLDGFVNKPSPSLPILCTCFSNFTPGVLTRLVLNSRRSCYFLGAAEDLQPFGNRSIEVPRISKQALEDIWLHITVLQLYHLYLPWTSKVYYGLTKLHLTGDGYDVPISEQQVVDILKSSPQLRVLRFGLNITDSHPTGDPIVPVYLKCLEVLVWESKRFDSSQLRTFLQLIAPSLNPLQLSIGQVDQNSKLLDAMKRFFARSNVTKLRMDLGYNYTSALLDTLPPLEILSLLGTSYFLPGGYGTPDELDPHSAHSSSFQTLHVQFKDYTSHFNEIKRITKRHSVQALKLDPELFRNPADVNFVMEHIDELRTICPSVELFDADNPSPLRDAWNEALA